MSDSEDEDGVEETRPAAAAAARRSAASAAPAAAAGPGASAGAAADDTPGPDTTESANPKKRRIGSKLNVQQAIQTWLNFPEVSYYILVSLIILS